MVGLVDDVVGVDEVEGWGYEMTGNRARTKKKETILEKGI